MRLRGVPVIIHGMSDDEYHDGRAELSSSWARRLLPEFEGSPAHFRYEMDNKKPGDGNPAFDFGHAAHAEILGIGTGTIVYPAEHLTPSGAISTKAATVEWQKMQRASGLAPITQAEEEVIKTIRDNVLANPNARSLLELSAEGREVTVVADVDGVPSRCRFDALTVETPQGVFGVDVKTTRKSASVAGFKREALDLGYYFQQEWYRDTYRASEGAEINFVFIVVEKKPPYLVAVHQLDVTFQQAGKTLAREARRIYAECTASGVWPGYPEDVQLVGMPTWAAMQHEEKYG